MSAIQYSV